MDIGSLYRPAGHGLRHQTCLAHLDRKARFVAEHGGDLIGMRFQLWFDRAFRLAHDIADLAVTTVTQRKRTLMRDLDAILASSTDCPLARDLLGQIRRARDQILTFCDFAGKVDATNNVSERALRPSVIQRKVTNGYRAKWAADAEAALRPPSILRVSRAAIPSIPSSVPSLPDSPQGG
jgi:transposase